MKLSIPSRILLAVTSPALLLARTAGAAAPAVIPLDVVFAVDESTSMKPAQNGVRTQVSNMFAQLAAVVPTFRVGLVGFGQQANVGNPVLRHVLTRNESSFRAAVGSLKSNGGREPGYLAAQQIAANLVGGRALNTDPKYPGPFPAEPGYCIVLVSDEDSDGVETLSATASALTSTGGHFFAITNGQKEYKDLANATGGTSHDLAGFIADSRPVLESILETCVARIQCPGTTYHIWNSTSNKEVAQFYDGWKGCIKEPFNLEARLCEPATTPPVRLKLWCGDTGYVVRGVEDFEPYFLFGNLRDDVLPNTKPLPNEEYRFYTTVDGVTTYITFTQACP
jgi:von Willebrand factor type A domain